MRGIINQGMIDNEELNLIQQDDANEERALNETVKSETDGKHNQEGIVNTAFDGFND